MADIGWLFGWAKENAIDIPLNADGTANIPKLFELYDEWRERNGKQASARKTVNLSKQEWARVYSKLGEIKRGGSVIRTAKGDIVIPLHKMHDGDTVKLVFIGGTYEQPTMKSVFQFADEDDMNDFIEEIERGK